MRGVKLWLKYSIWKVCSVQQKYMYIGVYSNANTVLDLMADRSFASALHIPTHKQRKSLPVNWLRSSDKSAAEAEFNEMHNWILMSYKIERILLLHLVCFLVLEVTLHLI